MPDLNWSEREDLNFRPLQPIGGKSRRNACITSEYMAPEEAAYTPWWTGKDAASLGDEARRECA